MSSSILIPGMGGGAEAKALSKNRSGANASITGMESWVAEMAAILNRSAATSGHGGGFGSHEHGGLLAGALRREDASPIYTQAHVSHDQHAHHLAAGSTGHANNASHAAITSPGSASGHAATSGKHADPQALSRAGAPSSLQQGAHLLTQDSGAHATVSAPHHGIATTAGSLHGVAAETHHALTHQGAQPPAVAHSVLHSVPSILNSQAGAAVVDADGNALPSLPADALAAMLRAAQASGDIRDASLRVVRAGEMAGQDMADASSATRRKLMDALQDLGSTGMSAANAEWAMSADASTLNGVSMIPADSASASLAAEALTDRPVEASGDLAGFLSLTDRATGSPDGLQGSAAATAVNADLDWMAVIEQQAGLSRLKETDALRLDLQLQDSQRVALEASLQDGVLTVKLGARADGSFWVPAEQLEALKNNLRMSTPEVQEVVFEQSADFGSSESGRGSGDASDPRSDERQQRLATDHRGGGNQQGNERGSESGRSTTASNGPRVLDGDISTTSEAFDASRSVRPGASGISLRA